MKIEGEIDKLNDDEIEEIIESLRQHGSKQNLDKVRDVIKMTRYFFGLKKNVSDITIKELAELQRYHQDILDKYHKE